MAVDSKLRQQLADMDEQYGGDEMIKLFGFSGLSYTSTDSSRMNMTTSYIKQSLTLLNPDVPRLQTGFENKIGEFNTSYTKISGQWEVKDVIHKFPNSPEKVYTIVIYNASTDTYDMIENKYAENLTERFGFLYNNNVMDSLEVGDVIKDEVISKSTSYDENMNYRYGKNAKVYYSTSTDTLEDSIAIRKGWADDVKSVEIDDVQVSINDNDILINLYGNENEYKAFPDIGEKVNNATLCATRRINKAHIFHDFQTQNMQEVKDTDTDYFVTKDSIVYDINIFYNGDDEFPDTVFYSQMKKYYQYNRDYASNMLTWTDMIKASGSNFTSNITYIRSKYLHYNDPEYKWKNRNSVFNHIFVEFKVMSIVGIEYGSKFSGRFGDKGVVGSIVDDTINPISKNLVDSLSAETNLSDEERVKLASNIQIIDDARMPYTDDGPVDIILNMSGAVRRLNPGQLCENEVNFIAEEVRKKIVNAKTLEAKKSLFFKFMDIVNEDQSTYFKGFIDSLDETITVNSVNVRLIKPDTFDRFIKSIETDGFYIVRPPHRPLLYRDIVRLYEEFDDIGPVPLYINLFGIKKRRIIKDAIVGSRYIFVLKQNTNKKFSARSTFRVNRSNLPTKDSAKKMNRTSYARTPVRLSEIYNLLTSISGRDIAEYNIFTRSSALGRKSLSRILSATDNPLAIKKLRIKDNFTNLNADILNCRLKSIGIGIDYRTEDYDEFADYEEDTILTYPAGGFKIVDKLYKRPFYNNLFNEYNEAYKSFSMVETYRGEKSDLIWDLIYKRKNDLLDGEFLTEEVLTSVKDLTTDRLLKFETLVTPKPPQPTTTTIVDENGEEIVIKKKKRGRKPKNWKPEDDM